MVVPYTRGLSKSAMSICDKEGIQAYFGGGNTIQSLLGAP